MPIQSIETRRVYQQIADQLSKLIRSGEFKVNSRLPSERDLANKFGASRPSVREALIALEVMGIVQIKMGSGVYVCEPAQSKQRGRIPKEDFAPFDVIQARLLIESEIAAQAAIARTASHVAQLEALLYEMMDRAQNNQNPLESDQKFHRTLAEATGNQVLANMVEQLFNARLGVLFSRLSNYFDTKKTWDQAIKEHRAILKAVKAQDAVAARKAMQHHMERAYNRFSASWGKMPAIQANDSQSAI
jgi:DNA-binding FadR family transcriptional regulator